MPPWRSNNARKASRAGEAFMPEYRARKESSVTVDKVAPLCGATILSRDGFGCTLIETDLICNRPFDRKSTRVGARSRSFDAAEALAAISAISPSLTLATRI